VSQGNSLQAIPFPSRLKKPVPFRPGPSFPPALAVRWREGFHHTRELPVLAKRLNQALFFISLGPQSVIHMEDGQSQLTLWRK
jgi:hypothetical protein